MRYAASSRSALLPGAVFVTALLLGTGPAALPGHAQTLVHQYVFNGNVSDTVGSANGTLQGGATASGGVLSLDGTDDYVQFGSHIVPTSGSYSVTLFATRNANAPLNTLFELISQGSSGPGFFIGRNADGTIRASDAWVNTGVAFPTDTARHHFALTVDATVGPGTSVLYVDGVQRATLANAITSTNLGTDTRFGRQFDPFAEFFGGQMQDVRIYSGALSSGQVAALNAAGPVTSVAAPEPSALALALPILSAMGMVCHRRRKAA
jgi:hypothetical protein